VFDLQLAFAAGSDPVKAGTPAEFGNSPFRLDPSLALQSMQRRIERTLVNLKNVLGYLLNTLRYSPAMQDLRLKRSQDQKIKRPLEKIGPRVIAH